MHNEFSIVDEIKKIGVIRYCAGVIIGAYAFFFILKYALAFGHSIEQARGVTL